jgi:dihydrofolate reductase
MAEHYGSPRREKGSELATVLLDMAISQDGFIGVPGEADPGLYDWYLDPSDASRPVVEELVRTTGAIVLGRGAFGTGDDADGWDDTPYAVPHFVVTHRPPVGRLDEPVEFVFVTDGVVAAVARAREAAGDRYATIGGGADVARQCLADGLVDEIQLHVVPVLLGSGIPLFDGSVARTRLTKIRAVDAPNVTHLRYRVQR